MDSTKKNSRVVDSLRGETAVILDKGKLQCYWNDVEFPEGRKFCDKAVAYECQMGAWLKLNREC